MLKNELTEQDKINHWKSLYNKLLGDFEQLTIEYKKQGIFNDLLIEDNCKKADTIRAKKGTIERLEKTIQDLQINISKEINQRIK